MVKSTQLIVKKTSEKFCQLAHQVIRTELAAIEKLDVSIDDNFASACEKLLACRGRIIVTGMGKSGHIAGKIAATLASTGTPAFFVHAGEAGHGDLGMITAGDIVIVLSSSGSTEEIALILPLLKKLGVCLIAMTGNPQSLLAQEADIHLDVSVEKEAGPHNLAPTASTTVALVMGDALAIALLNSRNFTKEDFAFSHPAGYIGKCLLLQVKQIMHTGNAIPQVSIDTELATAIIEMTKKSLGITAIVDKQNKLLGIFTDGDLRRVIEKNLDLRQMTMGEVMTTQCKTVRANTLAADAFKLMEQHQIFTLLVVDDKDKLIGAFSMHDLFHAGVIK
ncbi:MAG: KpsF/GutQ family sugar-phosphate isomerase [Pseudomonadota bacterium]